MYATLHVAVHPAGPGACRVTVTGDLDVVSAPDVREALQGCRVRPRPRRPGRIRQTMTDARTRHHAWIREHGDDLPEVADWTWTG
ncbi:hypothetical protein [Streptomyces antibioticus]|uniref:hypothetical protein n=1 Tax=Streptomyces antibioticus TaxID=1890 RepID=UPI0033E1D7BC